MKILAISHIFPPAIDGGSKVVYQLSHQLESQCHDVIYLSSDCFSTDDFVKKNPSVFQTSPLKKGSLKVSLFKGKTGLSGKGFIRLPVYHHLRRPLKFINLFIPKSFYLHQLLQVFQKGPIFKIIPFIKATIKIIKFKPDLIIAGPLPTTIILYANFFKRILSAKLLINSSFHQSDQDFSRLPLIQTLQRADYLWTLTKYETDFFIKKLNINPDKIILAGNGVESIFLKTKKNKSKKHDLPVRQAGLSPTILFVGSLAAHKRVDLLIKSFSLLLKANNYLLPAKLIVAGQKTLFFPQIEKSFKALPKSTRSQIHFKFNINSKDLIKLIDQCQFLVLPSIQESFGLVLVESWARKKAVITSDILPLKEIVTSSKGGLIFKTDDIDDLQQKIQQLILNPKLCRQFGQNGYLYVKNNYTWTKVSQKICQKILPSV